MMSEAFHIIRFRCDDLRSMILNIHHALELSILLDLNTRQPYTIQFDHIGALIVS
ncbi:MAG: hypothetical protein WCG25_08775 [bacterium]